MVDPKKVKKLAKAKEFENFAFRTFLKENAGDEEFDDQVHRLHEELFANYDCNQCRNCCKEYHGSVPAEDLERDAEYLRLSVAEFKSKYLEPGASEDGFTTKNKPCNFLQADGSCLLGEYKPRACKEYPHTDKPERLSSLLNMLDQAEICPIVYEMFERLKQKYEDFDQDYIDEFREMTERFEKHAPSGVMSAEDWFALQNSVHKNIESDMNNTRQTPFCREEEKIGRNDPCPCGSGKKYKKCCGRQK